MITMIMITEMNDHDEDGQYLGKISGLRSKSWIFPPVAVAPVVVRERVRGLLIC